MGMLVLRAHLPLIAFAAAQLASVWALAQGGPASVEVEALQQRTVASSQTFLGTIKPPRVSVIGSAVAGRVEKILVEEGAEVRVDEEGKGQPLAQLRTKTIGIEIQAAQAQVLLKQHELRELTNGARPEEIRQATARRDSAKALFDYALERFKRTDELYLLKGVSKEDYDEATSAKIAAEKAKLAAEASLELISNGPRKEQIDQARARLRIAEEEVNRLEDRRNKYTLRTPFTGYVVAQHVEIGDWVQQGDPIAEVIELDPAEIELGIPEQFISAVRLGMAAQFRLEAFPGELFEGQVAKIIPNGDTRTRTFPIRIRFANPKTADGAPKFKAGMLARATIPVGASRPALLAPKDALVLSERGAALMVVVKSAEGQTARRVNVKLGAVVDSWIEITDLSQSLQAGMQVVVKGNERLRPNQAIRILPRSNVAPANRISPQ